MLISIKAHDWLTETKLLLYPNLVVLNIGLFQVSLTRSLNIKLIRNVHINFAASRQKTRLSVSFVFSTKYPLLE